MYLDDIKLFAKNQKEMETLIQTARIKKRGRRDGIWLIKYTMLIMRSGKWYMTERIELLNQEK